MSARFPTLHELTINLFSGFSTFISDLLQDCNLAKDIAEMPLKFNQPIYGTLDPSFTEFMAPGVIIIIIFFLAVALTGEAFISEKQDGLLDRSWVSGVLPIEVMASHILTQFLSVSIDRHTFLNCFN